MADEARCRASREGTVWVLAASGRWTLDAAPSLEAELVRLEPKDARSARLDLAGLEALDTAGAWLLYRLKHRIETHKLKVDIAGAAPQHMALLERMAPRERQALARVYVPPIRAMVERVGESTVEAVIEGRDLLNFFGLAAVTFFRTALRPSRIRFISLVAHLEHVGLNAMPIVGLLSFLIGVVLAYQGADQLRAFGAEIYAVNLLGVSALREIGVLLTAILVAGRSGSAFTAEIGTMKVNEEVDAMHTLGLDVVEVLVLPRIIAVTIALPLLVFFADMAALAGGALMSTTALGLSLAQFLEQLRSAISFSTYWAGLVKAPVFAVIIGLTGCYHGLKVEGGAESVGSMTTRSVVHAIFLVIVADAAFSIFFSWIGV